MKEHLRGQRGFTLLEMLIAIAISLLLIGTLTYLMRAFFSWNVTIATRQTEHAQFGALVDRLRADEDTAWAIFTPATDVLGQSNGDGHEVDFFARDGQNRPVFWAYRYDNSAHSITKYQYATPGASPTVDESTAVAGVVSFKAATYSADKLSDPASPIYSPIYAGHAITPVAMHYGYAAEVAGGNAITTVTISGATDHESLQLSTDTAPSGWNVRFHYTKATLNTWPVAVLYGANGTNAASIPSRRHFSVAQAMNALLGGATADATVTCPAIAYRDSGMTQIDASDATYRSSLGIYTDGNGCIMGPAGTGGYVVASEPSFTGAFTLNPGDCAGNISFTSWHNVTAQGGVDYIATGGGTVTGRCVFSIAGSASTSSTSGHGLVTAQVNSGSQCSIVGEQCSGTWTWQNDEPYCDASGMQSGFTGSGVFSLSPSGLGTLTQNGSMWTFSRTNVGTVTVSAKAASMSFTTKNGVCAAKSSNVIVKTWTLP